MAVRRIPKGTIAHSRALEIVAESDRLNAAAKVRAESEANRDHIGGPRFNSDALRSLRGGR